MGLFLSLLYILTAYLAPTTIFGPLAEYRVELFLAALTLIVSVTKIAGSRLFGGVQAIALPALAFSVALSIAGSGWIGGAPVAMLAFVPNVAVFYFVALNCKTPKHLKWLVVILLCAAIFIIAHARYDILVNDPFSQYLVEEHGAKENFYRIRGLALVNDPNDLAQFLVAMVPCAFFLWRKGSGPRNALLVYLPIAVLVYGLYLTHSRGGMLALLAILLLAVRPKIGTLPAAVVAGIGFVAFTALGWSGGRDISANSGSDRMDAWYTGLQMIRAHPFLGVGVGHFQDFYEITAHNTIVVCCAEVGLIGFFCWMMFVLPTVRDAIAGSRSPSASEGDAESDSAAALDRTEERDAQPSTYDPEALAWAEAGHLANSGRHRDRRSRLAAGDAAPGELDWHALDTAPAPVDRPLRSEKDESAEPESPELVTEQKTEQELDAEEVRRLCRLMLLSISGFLAAGWFLSRAFVLSLFLLGGMISVVYRLTVQNGAAPPLSFGRAAKLSAYACTGALGLVYALLRVTSLVHR